VESGGLGLRWSCRERTRDGSRPSDSTGNENDDKNTLARHAPPSGLMAAALHMGLLWRFGFDAHRIVWQIQVDILGVTFDQSGVLPEERSGEFSTFVSATVGLERARDHAKGADRGESKSRQVRARTLCCSETVALAVNRPRKSSSFWEVAGGNEGNDKIVLVFQVPVPVARSSEEALAWWSGETGFVGGSDELTGGGYLVAAPPSTLSVVVTAHAEYAEEEEQEQEDRRVGRADIGMNHLVNLERMMGTGRRWPVVFQGDMPFNGADDGCGGGSVRIRVKQCVSIVSGSDPVRNEELEEEEEEPEQEEKLGSLSLTKSAASVSCDFDKSVTRLGMVLQPLSAREGQKRGCYIQKVHPGTAAAARGLRAGMTLECLNGVDGVSSLAFSVILTRLKQRPTSTRWVQTFSSRNLPHGSV
jgi:hypothetical protein